MPFETVIRYCAPTLAGIKVGSLFSFRFSSKIDFLNDISDRNKLLNPKGLFFRVLKLTDNFALIYVYRKNKLEEILKNENIREFLLENEYFSFELEDVLINLEKNLIKSDFPHEIGVFLGYPLSDIKAFILDKGANAKYVGCWKAYTNEDYARKISEKYKKCTNVYFEKYIQGIDINRLTVAC